MATFVASFLSKASTSGTIEIAEAVMFHQTLDRLILLLMLFRNFPASTFHRTLCIIIIHIIARIRILRQGQTLKNLASRTAQELSR